MEYVWICVEYVWNMYGIWHIYTHTFTDFIVITCHSCQDFGLVNVFMSADDQLIHKLLKLGLQSILPPGSHEIFVLIECGQKISRQKPLHQSPSRLEHSWSQGFKMFQIWSIFKRPLSHPVQRISFRCPRKHRTKPIIVYSSLAAHGCAWLSCRWWLLGGSSHLVSRLYP